MNNNGWIGTSGQLKYALGTFGADRDDAGKIKWFGTPPAAFMGIDEGDATEVVVSADAEVEIGGRRNNVASLLRATSYGLKIQVI